MSVVNPMNFGAVGDGTTDDLAALQAAVAALPTVGGIVFLPAGKSFNKDSGQLHITKNHVKFWAQNRNATIVQSTASVTQSNVWAEPVTGFGVFGVKFSSNATSRSGPDQVKSGISSLIEMVGNEVQGGAGTGLMFDQCNTIYVEGNYVHHMYADTIHHVNGTYNSWCWGNWLNNAAPSNGDDGIACVTYNGAFARGHDMEWWKNTFLHSDVGRGYTVIGGNDINIHDNWAIGAAAAGILVGAESSYNSTGSSRITVRDNFVTDCAHVVTSHPGILISGSNGAGNPVDSVTLTNNISLNNDGAGAFRSEGFVTNLVQTGLNYTTLPTPIPTVADVQYADTTVLRTRDTSHVTSGARPGLYRIHVRPSGGSFQQRFEYVFSGTPATVASYLTTLQAAGAYVSENRTVSGTAYALVLSGVPLTLPGGLTPVTFLDMRAGDLDGSLSWLWSRVNGISY